MTKISHRLVQAGLAAAVAACMGATAGAAETPREADRIAQALPERGTAQAGIRADRLIGGSLYHTSGEKVGEIESVLLGRDGRIEALVVGVGGFLGIGRREVAIGWNNVTPGETGYRMTTSLSKEELKTLPEYRFRSERDRRTAFSDPDYRAPAAGTGGVAGTSRADGGAPVTTAPTQRGESGIAQRSGDQRDVRSKGWSKAVGPQGEIRVNKFIGTPVMNARNEKIGEIEEILIEKDGRVSAVVSVGGFLGLGERHVLLPWNQLALDTRGDEVRASMDVSKEQLEKMPRYRKD